MSDKEIVKGYSIYLKTLNSRNKRQLEYNWEHPLREQAENLRVDINALRKKQEEKNQDDDPIRELGPEDVLEILYKLAKFMNKRERGYWEKQVSVP